MNSVYSLPKFKLPVDMFTKDNSSQAIGEYPAAITESRIIGSKAAQTGFAQAIYGDGPYSLEHPNMTTDLVAMQFDVLA